MHLYLIGYRGSGKSTVGRVLAQRLGRPFSDSDDVVESESGLSIKSIFEQKGEPWFRDLEAKVIAELAAESNIPRVISLGGGAVLRESTQTILKATGICIWLTASAEFLFQRIHSDEATKLRRPNLSKVGGYAEVDELLKKRTPTYRELSDLTVAVEGKTPDDICDEIVDYVNSAGQSTQSSTH